MPPEHDPGQPHHPSDGHTHGHHDGLPDDTPWAFGVPGTRPLRIGIGGPVGSGKTALVAALCRRLASDVSTVVVTNDIFTTCETRRLLRLLVLSGVGGARLLSRVFDALREVAASYR